MQQSNQTPYRQITAITIQGFRSLADIQQLPLPQLSVLIGSNGAGKSNLIRFFELLGCMLNGQHLQDFVIRHGGGDDQLFMGARHTPTLQAAIHVQLSHGLYGYAFALSHTPAQDTLYLSSEVFGAVDPVSGQIHDEVVLPTPAREAQLVSVVQQDVAPAPLFPSVFGREQSALSAAQLEQAREMVYCLQRCATYQFHDTSDNAYIKQAWDVSDNTWLRHDGGNLAAILLHLYQHDVKRYQLIVRQIQRVLPSFADFVLQPSYGKVALRWRSPTTDKTFGAHLTSDGSLRLFCLLTLLNLPDQMLPDVLFLDEPELGLHPHAINLVAAGLKRVAQRRQVFIATQSPYMVDCFELENMIVARLAEDGSTTLNTLDRANYQQWLDDEYQLSELWLTDVIGSSS